MVTVGQVNRTYTPNLWKYSAKMTLDWFAINLKQINQFPLHLSKKSDTI